MSRPAAAERGSECRLHVLEAGWQKRHGGVPGSTQDGRMGWQGEGVQGRGGRDKGSTGESVCGALRWSAVCWKWCVFACCSSVHTRVLATVPVFACMSMLMSTRSWGQTLTHKWNLATWVPASLSWARTAADLASLSGAVSTRQDSKRRAWREGTEGRGGGVGGGSVVGRSPHMNRCQKSRLVFVGKRSPVLANGISWETRKQHCEVRGSAARR